MYMAVYVCFTSKAVHIELVSDLTCDGFVLPFQRFVSSRGLSAKVCCNNATTFVEASRALKFQLLRAVDNIALTQDEMVTMLAKVETALKSRSMAPLTPDPLNTAHLRILVRARLHCRKNAKKPIMVNVVTNFVPKSRSPTKLRLNKFVVTKRT